MENKICKVCKKELPLSSEYFHKSIGYKDGYFSKCKICCKIHRTEYIKNNPQKILESQRKYEAKNKPHRDKYKKDWLSKNLGISNKYNRISYNKIRKLAFEKLGGCKCCNCGCDKYELLEINHINGGGAKEMKEKYKGSSFIRAIVLGDRKIDDLNILSDISFCIN
jgi:hypothetical protein